MSNARGSGSASGTSTTPNDASNPSLRDATLDSGSGSGSDGGSASGRCNMGTTVEFGDTGYISTAEEEGCGPPTIQVPIIVGYPGTCPVSVNYTTQNGTAIANTDYKAVSGTASIPAGSAGPYLVNIPILDDGTDESVGSEVFYVQLSGAQNAQIGGDNPFVVNIAEDPQQKATDTLRWNPCPNSDLLASDPVNWYDETWNFQLEKGDPGPGPSTPVQFNANSTYFPNSNAPIAWDKNFTVASISLIQYTGLQTILPGVKVESIGSNGTSLDVDPSSSLDLDFADSLSIFQIDNNAQITSMNLTAVTNANGQFIIAGGTTLTGISSKYTDQIGVSVYIYKNATFQDAGSNTLQLTGDPLTITVVGTMVVYQGNGNGMVLIDSGSNSDDYIDVIGGKLNFNGTFGIFDYFNVPIKVENGGWFQVSSGQLTVTGANTSTKNFSVYLTGASSEVNLLNTATLVCNNDYYQDSGSLATGDSSECTLKNGSTGTDRLNINGGRVIVDNKLETYGKLDVKAQSLFLKNTTLMVWILGYDPTKANAQNDQLNVQGGSLGVDNTDTLTVGVDGTPQNGDVWLIITADGGMGGDFGTKNSAPQTNGLSYGPPGQPKPGNYQVQMPKN